VKTLPSLSQQHARPCIWYQDITGAQRLPACPQVHQVGCPRPLKRPPGFSVAAHANSATYVTQQLILMMQCGHGLLSVQSHVSMQPCLEVTLKPCSHPAATPGRAAPRTTSRRQRATGTSAACARCRVGSHLPGSVTAAPAGARHVGACQLRMLSEWRRAVLQCTTR
jgi:hypothetical protein